jgi:hypothetical protein
MQKKPGFNFARIAYKKTSSSRVYSEKKDQPGFIRPEQQNRNQVGYWQRVFVTGRKILQMGKF